LPVFITLDPSYSPFFNTVSQRLNLALHQKEAQKRANKYKEYLRIFSAQSLDLDPKSVGLPGSPTIVYKVEKIPRAKANRKADIIDGYSQMDLSKVASQIYGILGETIIK
jgi:electron transfer flavoprotein beta subunit